LFPYSETNRRVAKKKKTKDMKQTRSYKTLINKVEKGEELCVRTTFFIFFLFLIRILVKAN